MTVAEDFLAGVTAEDGNYCLFAANKKENKIPQQTFYSSRIALIRAAEKLDKNGYDAYFALATFETTDSRKVENVKQLRSFFLDLDCGPGKEYVDKTSAITALRLFCSTLSLPRPTMVDSGRGIHAYWPISEPLTVAEWLPVAEQLKKLCAENGLLADPSVTSDAARVLRIPTTHNHKDDNPSIVRCLGDVTPKVDPDWFASLLKLDTIGTPTVARSGVLTNATNAVERSNRESRFKDILQKTASGKGCEQLKIIVTDQEHINEPLWRAGLSIAKFCVGGDAVGHKISKNYSKYSERETQEKLNNIQGPYTCQKFDEFNPDVCPECPNWGKIKSPIVLGSRIKEAEHTESPFSPVTDSDAFVSKPSRIEPEEDDELPELDGSVGSNILAQIIIPKYPAPYFRGANGGVYTRHTDEDGNIEEKSIYHNDLYVVKRVFDEDGGEAVLMRLHLPRDGVREFVLPISIITSSEEFRRAISKQGVVSMDIRAIMMYTMTWINELQAQSIAANARRQFGWVDDKDLKEFVLGDRAIFADRIEQNPPAQATVGLFHAFEPSGTLDAWKDAIEFWNRPDFEPYQYVVGMGFGSVLMPFTTVNCAAMHLYSKDSGVAKTTAMVAACGIWGSPEDLILGQDDTTNSIYNRAEVYHNLPWCIDEITNIHPKAASDLVYTFTGGKQKNRMGKSANTERVRGRPWNLMAITTGNTSLVSRVAAAKAMPKAEAQRVLECQLPDLRHHFSSKQETDDFDRAIHANYGLAGEVFVKYVMNNLPQVQSLMATVSKRVDNAGELTAPDRFWSAHITASIVGAIVAKRAGLINFDTVRLFDWAITSLLKNNKSNATSLNTSVAEMLSEYVTEYISDILRISDGKKGGISGVHSPVLPEHMARNNLRGRYEPDTKRLFLRTGPLKDWCVLKQLDYNQFVDDIMEHTGGNITNVRLGKGTNLPVPAARCLFIPMDGESGRYLGLEEEEEEQENDDDEN